MIRLKHIIAFSGVSVVSAVCILGISVCALAASVPNPIPDTGQTLSYTDTFGEDADYTINPPSYTKLDAQGNALPDSASSWSMVRDNVTGLIWEVKTDDGSIHDKDNTYNWDNAQNAFIANLNTNHFGGSSDWRLPTVKELSSIVNSGTYNPAINTAYFPNAMSVYWSSTGSAYYSNLAWCVHFYSGDVGSNGKSSSDCVRAVRGGQSGSLGNLVINGDGTVTDNSTGLMWQQQTAGPIGLIWQQTAGPMTWEAAINYCESLSLGGHDDWRLPTRNELQSIVDYTRYNPATDPTAFPGTMSSGYWSSTTDAISSDYVWCVGFGGGDVYGDSKSSLFSYVRAVRGGQPGPSNNSVIVSPTTGLITTEAGGTAAFTIVLAGTAPTADVTINISSSNSAEGTVSPASLTFTPANWNTPQTVTVTGVDDNLFDGDVDYTVITQPAISSDSGYNGLDADDVSVVNQDDDVETASWQLNVTGRVTDAITVNPVPYATVLLWCSECTSDSAIVLTTDSNGDYWWRPSCFIPIGKRVEVGVIAFKDSKADAAISIFLMQNSNDPPLAGSVQGSPYLWTIQTLALH